jgi:CheY-like chemotaxis protein
VARRVSSSESVCRDDESAPRRQAASAAPGAEFAAASRDCRTNFLPLETNGFGARIMISGSTPSSAAEPNEQRATVLVAEDHLDSRDAMRALLEAFGYRVLLAANGREAIAVALEKKPDLILMDIMMPELDGFEATRELRRHTSTADTPIIAVTAMEGAQQLALQAGATDYVRKPIDIRGLLAKVSNWLKSPTN